MITPPHSGPVAFADESHERLLSNRRFNLRLTFLVILIVVVLSALLFLLVSRVFSTLTPTLEQDLRWKLKSGVVELRHTSDLALLTKNVDLLAQVTNRYDNDPDIVTVAFFDGDGKLVYSRGVQPSEPSGAANTLTETPEAYASWAPIDVEGLQVGSVYLVASKERLRAGARLYHKIVVVGLLGAAVALGLALLFVRRYIAPVLRLTQRTIVELEQKTEAALASTRAKSQFLANMSHEIRTPMNGVLGMVHLLQQTRLEGPQHRYVDVIAGSAKSLLTIVNDVLDFSKLEANKYELVLEPNNLRRLLDQSVGLFTSKAKDKGLELALTVDDGVPSSAVVDAERLRQVLANLLSNAVKFTDAGKVELTVGAEEDLAGQLSLEFAVADTGIGVAESDRARLFHAFSQLDASSTRAHEGTGLGLVISRRLVELMGGRMVFEPRQGGGSVFRFSMPVVLCEDVEPESETSPRGIHFECTAPVLVVDDNEINQAVAMEMLEGLGLEVEFVGGGRDAVEAVGSANYSLVLMDCQMPGVDGYQATREIRAAEPEGQRVPIIACTAHALTDERAKVLDAGMDDYLTKPIEPEVLLRTLARWLPRAPGSARIPEPKGRASVSLEPRPVPTSAVDGDVNLPPEEPTDLAILDETRRRPAVVVKLFLEKVPEQLAALREAALSGEPASVKALAHKLKGSAGSIGAARLAAVCDRLQLSAPAMGGAQLQQWVDLIERLHEAARSRLAAEAQFEVQRS